MYILNADMDFPPLEAADEDGLLAIGGELTVNRLLSAYRKGIFPWYNEDDPVCWWSPDPRCVLFPDKLKVSKSMNSLLRKQQFRFTMNQAFEMVMRNCASVKRKEGDGTWIHEEIIEAYCEMHRSGFAVSAETWDGDELVGGLYGIKLGNVFFGESMFSIRPNASKFAFIRLLKSMQDIQLVDCQIRSEHLVSLGAEMIARKDFIGLLNKYT